MKNYTDQTTTLTLVLDKKEAYWLHSVMQNSLWGPDYSETLEDKAMRTKFFEATQQPITNLFAQ